MTFDEDIPVLRIKVTGNEKSEYYSKITDESFKFIGYNNIQTVEACTPDTISEFESQYKLEFDIGRMRYYKNNLKSGVKYWREWDIYEFAIWYSHVSAWHKVVELDRPCIVAEHDCVLFRDFSERFKNEKLLSFGANPHYSSRKPIYTPLAALGYYITPLLASRMIGRAKRKKIDDPVDGFIHTTCQKAYTNYRFTVKTFHDIVCAIHNIDTSVGTVKPKLYGKKEILKWEGDDDKVRQAKEEINLSGVRG